MKLLIGLIGSRRSGKGTLIKHLRSMLDGAPVSVYSTGEFLIEELRRWRLPVTRENLVKMAISVEETFGSGTLSNVLRERMESCITNIAVYDSIRWKADLELVRSFPSFTVYVYASTRRRWKRAKEYYDLNRKEDEKFMTFKEFQRIEKEPTEIFIQPFGRKADVIINNDHDDPDKFRKEVIRALTPRIDIALHT